MNKKENSPIIFHDESEKIPYNLTNFQGNCHSEFCNKNFKKN